VGSESIGAFPPGADGSVICGPVVIVAVGRTETSGEHVVQAAQQAGLPAGTTPHDLRHHFASVLLAQGKSVIAVAERLGHENVALVLSTYGHLMPDSEDRTVEPSTRRGPGAPSVPQDKAAGS